MAYKVDVNASPNAQMAQLATGQQALYNDTYLPFENDRIADASANVMPRVNTALASISQQQQMLGSIQQRNMSRYGAKQDPRVQANMGRQMQLSNTAQLANAGTTLAQNLNDQNISALGTLASIGRGLSTQAQDGLASGMANQAARDSQYSQAMQSYNSASAQYNASPFTLFGLI